MKDLPDNCLSTWQFSEVLPPRISTALLLDASPMCLSSESWTQWFLRISLPGLSSETWTLWFLRISLPRLSSERITMRPRLRSGTKILWAESQNPQCAWRPRNPKKFPRRKQDYAVAPWPQYPPTLTTRQNTLPLTLHNERKTTETHGKTRRQMGARETLAPSSNYKECYTSHIPFKSGIHRYTYPPSLHHTRPPMVIPTALYSYSTTSNPDFIVHFNCNELVIRDE